MPRFLTMKTCIRYCRIGSTEFFPGTQYPVEFNPIDRKLRIYTVWGAEIVTPEFINSNFI